MEPEQSSELDSGLRPTWSNCLSRGLVLGAMVGLVLALIDISWALYRLDSTAVEWSNRLHLSAYSALILGGAGCWIGALIATMAWTGPRIPLPRWLSWQRIGAFVFSSSAAALVFLLRNQYWPGARLSSHSYEMGVISLHTHTLRIGAIAALSIAVLIVLFVLLCHFRPLRWIRRCHWLIPAALAAAMIYLAGGPTYMTSRTAPASYLHAVVVLTTLGAVTTGLYLRWYGLRLRFLKTWMIIVLLGISLALPAVIGAVANHQDRLFLYERTAKTHRLLWMNPGFHFASNWQLPESDECTQRPALSLRSPQIAVDPDELASPNHIVLIVIDTLRHDRLGAERDGIELTRELNRVAEESVEFTRAYTPTPATRVAIGSMLTGRNPGPPDYRSEAAKQRIRQSLEPTFRDSGIHTAAVPGHRSVKGYVDGFDQVHREASREWIGAHTSEMITDSAIEAAGQLAEKERGFLFVHYLDPHSPYRIPDDFDFGNSPESRYDAEVASTDRSLGRLLASLDDILPDDRATIIISDHGEEFWDHGYRYHAIRLYEESVRLVALMNLPAQQQPQVIDSPVSSADILPTIFDLYGLPNSENLAGRSWLRPQPEDRRIFLYSRYLERLATVDDRFKFILNRRPGILELYDLQSDPKEQFNLADHYPHKTTARYCEILQWKKERKIHR